MNIDLLISSKGEPGLICDRPFPDPVVAVIFYLNERCLLVEMEDRRALQLNIHVEEQHMEALSYADSIDIGILAGDQITDSLQVPFIPLEDEEVFPQLEGLPTRGSSVLHFESFLRAASEGQPIHRDDLGDEGMLRTVMGATQMVAPQYSQQLAHQRRLEVAPRVPSFENVPQFSGPMGPGGGSGGGRARSVRRAPARPAERHADEEND